ncbi:unnamed protein product [Caenorhabditis brenneri]
MWFIVGAVCVGLVLAVLTVVSIRFLYRSADIAYNPCMYNVYKDDYLQYTWAGMVHSAIIGAVTVIQLVPDILPWKIPLHMDGSVQVMTMVPTLIYYHLLVINYKYRYLEIRHMGDHDYKKTLSLEILCLIACMGLVLYSLGLAIIEMTFQPEFYNPNTQYTNYQADMHFLQVCAWCVAIIGGILMVIDLVRIAKNSIYCLRVECAPRDENIYWFRKYVSQGVIPHFISDFFLLFVPSAFLFARFSPVMTFGFFTVLAKCVIIAHPISFILIYMHQIKIATRMIPSNEMECRCKVCQDIKNARLKRAKEWAIRLRAIRSRTTRKDNRDDRMEEERLGGGAAAPVLAAAAAAAPENVVVVDEQPTETTPAIHTTPN